jgi:hypothetical protein
VEGQPAEGGAGVEVLRDGNERDPLALEDFHHLGEVHERPADPVDLVRDDDVDLSRLDVGHQPGEGGPIHVPAGVAAVLVGCGERHPAFGLLRLDVGLAGFTLEVQSVELLLEPLHRRLSGVDRASDDPAGRGARIPATTGLRSAPAQAAPPEGFKPKKS